MKELISCIKNLPKHFKESLVNLWRNGAMSFSSILFVFLDKDMSFDNKKDSKWFNLA